MFVKLSYWNCSGDQRPQYFPPEPQAGQPSHVQGCSNTDYTTGWTIRGYILASTKHFFFLEHATKRPTYLRSLPEAEKPTCSPSPSDHSYNSAPHVGLRGMHRDTLPV